MILSTDFSTVIIGTKIIVTLFWKQFCFYLLSICHISPLTCAKRFISMPISIVFRGAVDLTTTSKTSVTFFTEIMSHFLIQLASLDCRFLLDLLNYSKTVYHSITVKQYTFFAKRPWTFLFWLWHQNNIKHASLIYVPYVIHVTFWQSHNLLLYWLVF